MSYLFVNRQPLVLQRHEGKVDEYKTLPQFLKDGPLLADPVSEVVDVFDIRKKRDKFHFDTREMLVDSHDNPAALPGLTINGYGNDHIPALWSGYRSAITIDTLTGKLYKLKGIGFFGSIAGYITEEDHAYVNGGQFLRNTHYERKYSQQFNHVLREEGIEPVMEYAGTYKFPFRNRIGQVAASIMEVKGDTRLDELLYALERGVHGLDINTKGGYSLKFFPFYYELGLAIGQLKNLMDKSNMAWSDNTERTNAHIGNVVIYRADEQHLGIGFVDFDAAASRKEMSLSAFKKLQREENSNLRQSFLIGGVSFREVETVVIKYIPTDGCRVILQNGFIDGYAKKSKKVSNLIGKSLFDEVINLLPKPMPVNKKYAEYWDKAFERIRGRETPKIASYVRMARVSSL